MQQFADEAAAMEEARLKAAQLAFGRIEASDMTRSDRDELIAIRQICGAVPVIAAVQEWALARNITSGNIITAAEAWVARKGGNLDPVEVKRAVDEFMNAKVRNGVDVRASYKKVLPSFVAEFGRRSLHTISSRELTTWLEQRHPHPVTRNTVRKRLVTLWRWARKQGFLPRDAISEAEQTEAVREPETAIGVIDAKTYSNLLTHFRAYHPEYLAPLVLAGFCGLRRSEIHGQSWEDIQMKRKFVRVTAAKRNTPARRLVPLAPAAIRWLKLCGQDTGAICNNMAMDRIREIGRLAGFEFTDNCFRHSFISHRVAQTSNVAETALESGNSPKIIFRHYRELFTKAEGIKWFGTRPKNRP